MPVETGQAEEAEAFFIALNAFVPPGPSRGLRFMQKTVQGLNARTEVAERRAEELQSEVAALKMELAIMSGGNWVKLGDAVEHALGKERVA